MKLVKVDDISTYSPPGHFNVSCAKVQDENSGLTKFWQGLSIFEPDGGAEWQFGEGMPGSQFEKTYFVIEGEITVENEDGDQFVASAFDSISFLPNDKRKMWVSGGTEAKVLVTVSA
ncbi:cupin domain-containing protein [Photobacterium sp. DNB23_23_1]